jgi:pimeloyl-ACP methyl ester carboxylesterase
MVTKPGEIYVGRLPQMLRGVANIKFAVQEMQKIEPNADYDRLTVAGHSMGGDITMYFAKQYPDRVKAIVTLDNLRVPFITSGAFRILSFRSKDPQFKTDPGVLPSAQQREKAGITVVNTPFRHDDMRDAGSTEAKASIEAMLDKFLTDAERSAVTPAEPCIPSTVRQAPACVPVAPVPN